MHLRGRWLIAVLAGIGVVAWTIVLKSQVPGPEDESYFTVHDAVAGPYGLVMWTADPTHAAERVAQAIGCQVDWTVQATAEREAASRIFRFRTPVVMVVVVVAAMRDGTPPAPPGTTVQLTGTITAVHDGRIELADAVWRSRSE